MAVIDSWWGLGTVVSASRPDRTVPHPAEVEEAEPEGNVGGVKWLVQLAYPNAEGNIADDLARDSFLVSLEDGVLSRWVHQVRPSSFAEAHFRKDCPLQSGSGQKGSASYTPPPPTISGG